MCSFLFAGTLETAGLTPIQALEIVRGCRGLNLIGADVVEVRNLTKNHVFIYYSVSLCNH